MAIAAPAWYFDTDRVTGFDNLVAKFGQRAFPSPYRSTVPLLALVNDSWSVFEKALAACGVSGQIALHFEFKVNSRQEIGNPSQTDVMVLCDSLALAVEAKWTEPRYESVDRRLKRLPPTSQRRETFDEEKYLGTQYRFLDGWLDLLRPIAARTLVLDEFRGCVYQVLHRAASACGASRPPGLMYLHFVPALGPLAAGAAGTKDYQKDLGDLHRLLGHPSGFPFYLVEVPLAPTSAFEKIKNLTKRVQHTGAAVQDALVAGGLFQFGEPQVHRIGPM